MLRAIFPIVTIASVATLVACSGQDPVAPEANNISSSEVDVLPPDESAATPTNDLENGADEPVVEATSTIPASFQGRWALSPADCTSTRGDNKGLLTVAADKLTFYEARAIPAGSLKQTKDRSAATSTSPARAKTGNATRCSSCRIRSWSGRKAVRWRATPTPAAPNASAEPASPDSSGRADRALA